MGVVLIEIRARDFPGRDCPPDFSNVHVGIQRHRDVVDLAPGDAEVASWTVECALSPSGDDLQGPHIQGKRSERFIYLAWGTVDEGGHFQMFRKAKITLDAVEPSTLRAASQPGYRLVGSLGLTDTKGEPLCAAVRPLAIEWTASATPE
jgi:hypothetical protein